MQGGYLLSEVLWLKGDNPGSLSLHSPEPNKFTTYIVAVHGLFTENDKVVALSSLVHYLFLQNLSFYKMGTEY